MSALAARRRRLFSIKFLAGILHQALISPSLVAISVPFPDKKILWRSS